MYAWTPSRTMRTLSLVTRRSHRKNVTQVAVEVHGRELPCAEVGCGHAAPHRGMEHTGAARAPRNRASTSVHLDPAAGGARQERLGARANRVLGELLAGSATRRRSRPRGEARPCRAPRPRSRPSGAARRSRSDRGSGPPPPARRRTGRAGIVLLSGHIASVFLMEPEPCLSTGQVRSRNGLGFALSRPVPAAALEPLLWSAEVARVP